MYERKWFNYGEISNWFRCRSWSLNTSGKRTCKLTKDLVMDGKTYKKGDTIKEREFNQRILKLVEKELDNIPDISYIECMGAITEDTSLANRVKKANDNKVDLFVSIHANALNGTEQNKAQGLVCIHTKNCSSKSITMTKNMYNRLSKEVNWYKDGATRYGVRTDVDLTGSTYYVLRNTNMPATLLELGFMDNLNDVENMITDKFAKDCAKAIVKALCDTLSVSYPTNTSTNNSSNNVASTNEKLWRVCVGTYSNYDNAVKMRNEAIAKGLDAYIVEK